MSDKSDADENGATGYAHPPVSSRFTKGVSGNPKGRPKGRKRTAPHEDVLGQIISIKDGGEMRDAVAGEAFILRLAELAIGKGNNAASRALENIEKELGALNSPETKPPHSVEIVWVATNTVNRALKPLNMGRVLHRFDEEAARMVLEPWLVEEALGRLGDRRLSRAEQRIVLEATRTPKKVKWPDWWVVRPES